MKAIGIDLGGTKINIGVISDTGDILCSKKRDTPLHLGKDGIINALTEEIHLLLNTYGSLPIGIGTPGLVSFPDGNILGCTPNLPDWDQVRLKETLEALCKQPVYVDNDANVATWGEFRIGKGNNLDTLVLLTLGTGLGSGMILGGQLKRGFDTLGIGFGHMIVEANGRYCNCGQQGCLETYVSGTGLIKTYQILGGHPECKGPQIFNLAEENDKKAKLAIEKTLKYLAIGISNILNTLAPQLILLGGGMAEQSEKTILTPLREQIKAIMSMPFNYPEMIQIASLGSQAGLIGAALLAMDEESNGAYTTQH